ncbi:hypothetical protein FKM82_010061 [Ascaphus truei]
MESADTYCACVTCNNVALLACEHDISELLQQSLRSSPEWASLPPLLFVQTWSAPRLFLCPHRTSLPFQPWRQ